jgi:glyceraldehyde 3-phosphate dehydrogenase
MNDVIGIERGLMTTIHSYTNDQKILDQIHPDMRRARAAAMSMIPTTTGAAAPVGEVLPELKGQARRIGDPRADPECQPGRPDVHAEARDDVGRGQRRAARGGGKRPMSGVLDYSEEPLVSIDLNHNPASSTIDGLETAVLEGMLVRVVSWYDNRMGLFQPHGRHAGAMARLI